MLDLFSDEAPWSEPLAEGAMILRRRAHAQGEMLLALIEQLAQQNPFQHRITPGGHRMSVAMTNCGDLGWSSDARGYQYSGEDNLTGRRWPPMPEAFRALALAAAQEAGFKHFQPDACLINRYEPGAKLSLHQDKDEKDLRQPIVSVSLGLPAVFQFGGFERGDAVQRVLLEHGDVVVWGGPSRLRFHGVLPVKPGVHPLAGPYRYNLTFRRAR
ncbi:MAG: DNA oxidative demethylase AlkB [Mixta calida]|jgi:alkylated DNA repair protein (DNA oxidative demethylase)|uniref:DNA oxidative demethylase AlkB n=1 Tax=Mixta calida TaxID=665913 RepID=A0ABM6S3D4_9GAMM|nr:DNA oxidative demethylase AlkB [Mixta calida]AIX73105.1 alpha-ketoglutarate-dependent dioxygenase [Pantoea sp. PSNIH2]MDU3818584.1 DNA oxidative demethylase AlkB [Pantoea sp.]POU47067.1 DNA oxidative demethylase AlkB [Pantoea sp. PSNIH5]POU64789.1 DNA oxidative demethylase AlkB [Pantoea sp. PSNIH4]POY67719.1 DNA oxidative demethylase AlkB [Pantoea sp. PSNIH3]